MKVVAARQQRISEVASWQYTRLDCTVATMSPYSWQYTHTHTHTSVRVRPPPRYRISVAMVLASVRLGAVRAAVRTEFLSPYPPRIHTDGDPRDGNPLYPRQTWEVYFRPFYLVSLLTTYVYK